jgi:Fur family transcriptional regulator, peroxide stress response regulator
VNIHEFLAERGYRVTPQRVAIFQFIHGNPTHPSAAEVYEAVKEEYPMVSFATVYKTLETFVRLGLISEMAFPDGVNRFDSNPRAHFNLVCTHCRTIIDVTDELLPSLATNAAAAANFRVRSSRHELYGLCPECQTRVPEPDLVVEDA